MKQDHTPSTPWYRQAVIYQIYPWSFKDSNQDGIGDLRGIIEKLDYLNDGTPDSLGVGAIWISPIYPSPMKDFGYDISDYCGIDPRFGNLDIFDELVEKAHARGIKIIMDLVTNHTSDQHPWFVESRSSKDNPKRDWYVWHEPRPDGSAPNNWLSVSGGSIWTLDEKTGQYYLHNFLLEQPDLNWRNEEVQKEMQKVLEFWIGHGVNGFRVDAASHFVEDSLFRDDPINKGYIDGETNPYDKYSHIFSTNQPEIKKIIGLMCDISEKYKDIFIVSETYLGLEEIKRFYRFCDPPVHAPFNFQLMSLPWQAEAFKIYIDRFDKSMMPLDVPTYVLGNHDRDRVASQRGSNESRAAALLLLTLRGTPFVYYGEELGMKNVDIPKKLLRDGFVKTSEGMFSRDPERTPMQWDSTENAGFSKVAPWLPVANDYKTVNVEYQKKDSASMLILYKTLIRLRNTNKGLLEGSYRSLNTESQDIFAYTRNSDNQNFLVMINFSNNKITEPLPTGDFECMCTTHLDVPTGQKLNGTITLRPNEGYLLKYS